MNEDWRRFRSLETGIRISLIGGLFFFASVSAAQATNQSFKDFRHNNPELSRQVRRQIFREQIGDRKDNPQRRQFDVTTRVAGSRSVVGTTALLSSRNRSVAFERIAESSRVLKHTMQSGEGSNFVRLAQGVDLDLGSADRNITLGQKLFSNIGSVNVTIGGEAKTFEPGTKVTAAEYLAIKQILTGTGQQLILDSSGRAFGGLVDMNSVTSNHGSLRASDFIVPANVTTYCDFSKRSDFKLLGDLSNFGTIHASANRAGAIRADDIFNNNGALIVSSADLTLAASGNLTNEGAIRSSGNLTLSAGGVLKNSSEVSAINDVSLFAPTTKNSGVIQSTKGSVFIDGPSAAELRVEGNGGTIDASQGAINIRGFDYAGTANTIVSGGDLLSRELNLNAGQGVMRVNAGKLTGTVTQKGAEAHIEATTDNLVIGEVCLTGDPTFKNDSGNVSIVGSISVAEDLTIVASGNITSVDGITLQAANATQGFNISLIAGAAQVVAGVNSSTAPTGGTPEITSLTGSASASGGSVMLGDNVTITTRSTGATGAGGNVLIAAFEGATAGSGVVDIGGTSILTGGRTGADNNGDVSVIAGAQNTTAARIGGMDTTGGASSTGTISIMTAQPVSSNGANIDFAANGSISSGNSLIAGPTIGANAEVLVNGNVVTDSTLSVRAGGNIGTTTDVIASISVGANPTGAVINAAGTFAYVASSLDGTITVIDAVNNTVVGAPISVGLLPEQIVLSPDGSLAYVSNSGSNTVSVIDTASHTVIATVNVGASPTGVAVNADGSRVYVTNSGSNTISVIDTVTNQVIGSPIVTGAAPKAVFVDAANGRVYVGNTGDSSISIVDQSTLAVMQTVTIPTAPVALGGCPCGTKIFVAAQSDKVYAFSVESNSVVATIDLPAGANPVGIAINPTGSTAYTTNSGTGDITVITTLTNTIPETVSIGGTPQSSGNFAGFVGNNPILFITDSTNSSVRVLRTASLIAPQMDLFSSAGKILTATSGSSITAVTTSDVSITAAGNVTTSGSSSGDFFQFATRNDITINNPLVVGSDMDMHAIDGLFTNNSTIAVNGNTAFVASHQIINNGTMTAHSTTGSSVLAFQSPSGDLTVTSAPGAIFSSTTSASGETARIEFNPAFGFSVVVQGGIFVADTDLGFRGNNGYLIDVNAERIDPLVKVNNIPQSVLIQTATGTLTIDSVDTTATAIGPIDLRANGGSLIVQGDLTSPTSINLLSQNDLINSSFSGTISTPSLELTSTTGNVGLDSSNPFIVAAGIVDISGNALSATGSVFINSASISGVNFTDSLAGNDLFLSAGGSLTVAGDLTALNGDLDVRATTAGITTLTISDSVTLTGFSSINIINSSANKRSSLLFGTNSTIQTNAKTAGSGNITIAVGPIIVPPGAKKRRPPRNIAVNEINGEVLFTGRRPRALKPISTFTAMGADILMSNGLRGRSLEVRGGVTITADPPVTD